ncbi:hypothetical protein DAPPPG734_10205 [Pantoea agglomerans]|uniref:Uncharacterized protein n=1 Tax=Enterobacter agglomerans TaxID=549 RepID=A0AAN2FCI6_ENTAG|nr:hypothetical protein DAPPPG734_10205 [Pantoea agglomerans]
MCQPHDCQALSLKVFRIQQVKWRDDFLCLLVGLRGVCGNVTDFISVLQVNRRNLACLRPSAQSLAAKRVQYAGSKASGKGYAKNLT